MPSRASVQGDPKIELKSITMIKNNKLFPLPDFPNTLSFERHRVSKVHGGNYFPLLYLKNCWFDVIRVPYCGIVENKHSDFLESLERELTNYHLPWTKLTICFFTKMSVDGLIRTNTLGCRQAKLPIKGLFIESCRLSALNEQKHYKDALLRGHNHLNKHIFITERSKRPPYKFLRWSFPNASGLKQYVSSLRFFPSHSTIFFCSHSSLFSIYSLSHSFTLYLSFPSILIVCQIRKSFKIIIPQQRLLVSLFPILRSFSTMKTKKG